MAEAKADDRSVPCVGCAIVRSGQARGDTTHVVVDADDVDGLRRYSVGTADERAGAHRWVCWVVLLVRVKLRDIGRKEHLSGFEEKSCTSTRNLTLTSGAMDLQAAATAAHPALKSEAVPWYVPSV
jgi:hypothetical protein